MGKEKRHSSRGTGKRPGLQQEFYVFRTSENPYSIHLTTGMQKAVNAVLTSKMELK